MNRLPPRFSQRVAEKSRHEIPRPSDGGAHVPARDGAAMAVASQAYADQSHMIRDFYRFVGWAPATFLREHQNIAAATLLGRRMAGAVRPLVLWS